MVYLLDQLFNMKNLIIAFLSFVAYYGNTQTFTIGNQFTFGGNNMDFLRSVITTSDGGYIIGGSSFSGISGDKTELCRGMLDYWIVKLNSALLPEWQKTIGGNQTDELKNVFLLTDSTYILAGQSSSGISGEKTVINYGISDYWLVKLDKNRNILWQKTYGGTNNQIAVKSIINNNYLYIAGYSDSDSSGVKSENSRGATDYWIVKLDLDGNMIWDKTIGGADYDFLFDIAEFSNGDILLSGYSNSSISGDKTESNFGYSDNWIVRLDSNGHKIWDKTIGGSDMDLNGNVLILNDKIFLASGSSSNISGNKSENSRGGMDYWIVKLDGNGNIEWDKTIGGNAGDGPCQIIRLCNDKVLISGNSMSGISGEKTETCRNNVDFWLYCIDTNNIYLWQKTIGGSGEDELTSTLEISSGSYIICGTSDSGISGEKIDYCRGNYDFWGIELSLIVNNIEPEISDVPDFFPNPIGNEFYLTSNLGNIMCLTIYNMLGEKVMETKLNRTDQPISSSNLLPGVYICVIQNDNKAKKIKLIKQ